MGSYDNIFSSFSRHYESQRETEMSLEDYVRGCSDDPMMYSDSS